jgi:hypothetical protein
MPSGAGSGATALRVDIQDGYTGTGGSYAAEFVNYVTSTHWNPISNYGGYALRGISHANVAPSPGAATGGSVGIAGGARWSAVNIGVEGGATHTAGTTSYAGSTTIGVYGYAENDSVTSPQIGGYFSLYVPKYDSFTAGDSAALVADNAGVALPIARFKESGSDVVTINDGAAQFRVGIVGALGAIAASTGDGTFDTMASFAKSSTNATQLLIRAKNSLVDIGGAYLAGGGGANTDLSFSTTPAGGGVLTERMRITAAGHVGVGRPNASALVQIAAGTTAASTAPLKFTSGPLLTTPEAGSVEFLTDAFYGTITTGGARKTFAFLESPTFSGTVTAPAFSGNVTGNLTGNASGSAATVTGAAQTAITSVGALTSLDIAYSGSLPSFKVDDGTYGVYLSDQNTLNFDYGSNAANAGWINNHGYAGGNTQFRSLTIGNGEGAAIAYFDGTVSKVGIGTTLPVISGTGKLHMAADTMRLDTARTVASNAACNTGEISWDANYIYVCTASGVVKRAALTGGY